MITNKTIIKAAKAAGLDADTCMDTGKPALLDMKGGARWFDPLHNDTDNAMTMDGAEVDVEYDAHEELVVAKSYAWNGKDCSVNRAEVEYANNKDQARREWQELSESEMGDTFAAAYSECVGKTTGEIHRIYTKHISAALRAKN